MAGRFIGILKDNRDHVRTAANMAWPSVLESFFVALAGMVDSLMVSSMGAAAVAAVGLTTQPKFIGLSMFIAMNVSVSALVARRKGQQDRYGANQVLLMALTFTVAAGAVVSLLCVAFADAIIDLCGSQQDTHESAVLYFRIIMGGMMFSIVSLVINAAQRGSGNTKIAMRTNVTSNVINMIGNYLLIQGHFGFPALGIRGAAMATVFGTVIACIMSVKSISGEGTFVSIPYMIGHRVRLAVKPIKNMAKISSSVFTEQILMRIGFMATAVMTATLGTAAFAAHQVGMNILSLSFSFGDGMQAAAVALIGQSLGEQDVEKAKLYGTICQRMGNGISLCLAVIYLLGGRALYRLYFVEEDIVSMGVMIMQIMVIVVMLQISQVIYMGCLRGAGDVLFTIVASSTSVTVVRTVASYVFCFVLDLGLLGIWLGIASDQLSRFIFTQIRFRSGKWTQIKI